MGFASIKQARLHFLIVNVRVEKLRYYFRIAKARMVGEVFLYDLDEFPLGGIGPSVDTKMIFVAK